MKKTILLFCSVLVSAITYGQSRTITVDSTVITKHETTANGVSFPYTATTGTQPVWNNDGAVVASLFYTYYKRSDIKDDTSRPLLISFNGGPGSASVWMHVAYTGPKILKIDDEGYPVQPYGVKSNPYSVLDVADILYVNPVNTGYSRMVKDKNGEYPDRKQFFGVNADIQYLAEWVNTFVTRNNRWRSPKYIIGESYGGTRVAGLAKALQGSQWMYLNGVIMVSPADYKVLRQDNPLSNGINLPYFTAAAWHQKALSADLQNKDLLEILPEVEAYAINELIPALSKGGSLSAADKDAIATEVARYSGLSKQAVLDNNLAVPTSYFWKELKRNKGFTVGRLDSRYLGIDKKNAGDSPDYNSEITSWLHSFTPAINYYLREELNYKTDLKYNMFGSVRPWDNSNDNTRENLRQAMAENPNLHVLYQSGYYDGATTYFNAKYSMWQLDPSGKMKGRLSFKGYRSGHMMYLRKEDLEASNKHLREFILNTIPKEGVPAKY
ncbi:S10 family peptidase [Urechidicola vernalis]|uniref:Carboxypeptidase n=1 Tax=Urechidicola vernalis TaxID=3075600 RepID=A0ABU2Y6H5_9FLAO|nr:carboxypeptidase [Urechidicola sp. P050]MDT0553809.1 carboxypeptidase [Urechidicola sp. P050]